MHLPRTEADNRKTGNVGLNDFLSPKLELRFSCLSRRNMPAWCNRGRTQKVLQPSVFIMLLAIPPWSYLVAAIFFLTIYNWPINTNDSSLYTISDSIYGISL